MSPTSYQTALPRDGMDPGWQWGQKPLPGSKRISKSYTMGASFTNLDAVLPLGVGFHQP